jgi:hypothetical protein
MDRVMPVALACCVPLMTSLSAASVSEHRSREIAREFQWQHPCSSTGRAPGARPGYVRENIVPVGAADPTRFRICSGRPSRRRGQRIDGDEGLQSITTGLLTSGSIAGMPEVTLRALHQADQIRTDSANLVIGLEVI